MKMPYTLSATIAVTTPLSVEQALARVRAHIGERESRLWWRVRSGSISEGSFTVRYEYMQQHYQISGRVRDGRRPLLVLLRCQRPFGKVTTICARTTLGAVAMLLLWWGPSGATSFGSCALGLAGMVLFMEVGTFIVAQSFVDEMREVWTTLLEGQRAVQDAGRLTMR